MVFMGMGEPFLNPEGVSRALDVLFEMLSAAARHGLDLRHHAGLRAVRARASAGRTSPSR